MDILFKLGSIDLVAFTLSLASRCFTENQTLTPEQTAVVEKFAFQQAETLSWTRIIFSKNQ